MPSFSCTEDCELKQIPPQTVIHTFKYRTSPFHHFGPSSFCVIYNIKESCCQWPKQNKYLAKQAIKHVLLLNTIGLYFITIAWQPLSRSHWLLHALECRNLFNFCYTKLSTPSQDSSLPSPTCKKYKEKISLSEKLVKSAMGSPQSPHLATVLPLY